jgi:hypothetical protein
MTLQLLRLTQVKVVLRQRFFHLFLQLHCRLLDLHDHLLTVVLDVVATLVVAKCQEAEALVREISTELEILFDLGLVLVEVVVVQLVG